MKRPPELVAIEIFGTTQVTLDQVLAAEGDALRSFADDVMSEQSGWKQAQIEQSLQALGDFAFVKVSLIGYFEPAGMKYYLTVDFVDRADAGRRMPFFAAPEGSYEDPEGLIAAWYEYELKSAVLAQERGSGKIPRCPAWHCIGDHTDPQLAPLARTFATRVPANVDALRAILRDDLDPRQRAAAALLLAYAPDGAVVVEAMLASFRDPDDLVRNNVMRVIAEIAYFHHELDVPIEPALAALEYPATLDRNKAAAIVEWLLGRPGGERFHAAVATRRPTLEAMQRLAQPNNHDFAERILRAIDAPSAGAR